MCLQPVAVPTQQIPRPLMVGLLLICRPFASRVLDVETEHIPAETLQRCLFLPFTSIWYSVTWICAQPIWYNSGTWHIFLIGKKKWILRVVLVVPWIGYRPVAGWVKCWGCHLDASRPACCSVGVCSLSWMGPVLRRCTFACTLSHLLQFQLHCPGVTRPSPSWSWE